jgi:DNA replicative helicase MCM subunit Mcm2 (Cdc46/Mcm family)
VDFASFSERLNNALSLSARPSAVARDSEGRKIWAEVYPELSEGSPGLLGAVTSRAEAQVMRLSIVYALLDCSQVVRKEHLRAALAVWDYCLASCRFLFGTALGDPVTDDLCVMLRRRPEGMSRTEIRDAFGRHRRREEIDRSLSKLSELGLARSVSEATDGRSKERWFPVPATEATKATKG